MWYSSGSPKLARTTCLDREHVEAAPGGTGGFVARADAAVAAVVVAAVAVVLAPADAVTVVATSRNEKSSCGRCFRCECIF